jgi:class 3 adenylate cyclase
MLAKDPAYRPSDAAQVVREIEKILRGGVCDMAVHPRLPTSSARALWEKIFQWRFESTPEQLWPYVSNTERINRAAGLQSVRYRTEKSADGGLRRFGTFRLAGIPISWEEHPFEWIEGRRMGVLREFATGPFRSFISIVELNPLPEGGTLLKHTVRIDPRSAFGRIIATIEAGWKGGRALDRIYRRINESIQHQRQNSLFDPFEASSLPSTTTDKRARQCVEKMIQKGVPAERAEELKSFILAAAPQALGQLKPFELADRLQLTIEECLDACLIAAHCGLLKLRWDILCPTCRAPASTADLLAQIGQHTNCEACDTEFATDVASAIELVFEAHPEIREIDVGQYCIGGPEHSPHVVTQLRMDPDERIELMVPLTAGDYILRITRSSQIQPLRARTQAAPSRLDLRLSQLGESNRMPVVRSGAVNLSLTNDFSGTQVVRLERTIDRKNVITAATASALPRFRELFPEQIFDRKAAIASDNLTLLAMRVSSIDDLYFHHGDAAAYQLLQTILEIMENCVISHQGSVIKSINELMVCSFRDCALSVRAALEVAERIAEKSELAGILTVAAIHRGPLLVTTQNGRLDYFGTTVRQVTTLCDQAQHGILLSDTVFTDPATQEMLHGPLGAHANRTFSVTLPGFKCHLVQHIISAQKN